MSIRLAVAALLAAAALPPAPLRAQGIPPGSIGWYNGDWKPLIPSIVNWHASETQFAHLYDDFVVPEGGWTVTGVFGQVHLRTAEVQQAFWEIRSGVSQGNGGAVVTSGLKAANLTRIGTVGGGVDVYSLAVTGITAPLPPGRYWLCVAPVTSDTTSYLSATVGTGAIGEPKATNGEAYLSRSSGTNFARMQSTGSGGTSGDFSLGVVISGAGFTRQTAWRINLELLAGQMLALHSRPFPGVSAEAFAARSAELASKLDGLPDAEIRTQLQTLVASIGDPHTDVIWPVPRPYRNLPLSLYWFDDGVHVIGAPQRYRELLGGKVVWIGNSSIEDAITKVTPLTAYDNESWLRYMTPSKLVNTDFLLGTRVTDSTAGAEVQVLTASGELRSMPVEASDQSQLLIPAYQGELPLYRRYPEKVYWATAIDGGETVYFQYNRCGEDSARSSAEFFAELDRMTAAPEARRIVIDLRNNTGGTTGVLTPWFERLKTSRFNRPGGLYVIVGKATYSAAQAHSNRFRDETAAIFVGEPTGGKPQFLLRRGDFALAFYGLRVSYSSGTWPTNDPGPTLMPDVRVPVTFANYMQGIDPALDAIRRPSRRPLRGR